MTSNDDNPRPQDRDKQSNDKKAGFSKPQPREDHRSSVAPWTPEGLLPPLSDEEFEELKASIGRDGVLVPSIVDAEGNVIDGTHRERACKELGIFCPREIREFASEAEKLQLAISLNVARRHLTGKQRREVIAAYLRVDTPINDNHLGEVVGVSKTTVATVRADLEATCQIDKLEQRRGRDGKYRPAKYRRIIANTPKEAEEAREIIQDLPSSCAGKLLDMTTAARRARRHVSKQERDCKVIVPSHNDDIRLYYGPFQEIEDKAGIAPASVHLISTDIPYGEDFLPEVSALATFAERVLVPGGLLVTYSGQYHLRQVMLALDEHMTYRWMMASIWNGDAAMIHPLDLTSKWKPILIYSKGDWQKRGRWCDLLHCDSKEKDWHEWQQPLADADYLIRFFSQPGDLVVDPCAGGFTTAVACKNLGRRFIGCDIDKANVSKGQARLAGLSPADWERANQAEPDHHEGNGKE